MDSETRLQSALCLSLKMIQLYVDTCHLLRGNPDPKILEQLTQEPVTILDVSQTYIGPMGGFDSFLNILARMDELTSLNMNCSVLSTDNVRDLTEVLKGLKKLKTLRLCRCKLYVESGNNLLSLLRVNRSITELDISGNDIPKIVERKILRQLLLNQSEK